MKSVLGALLVAAVLAVSGVSCIIVDDHHHHHPHCWYECDGDFIVEVCDDGYMEDVDDCHFLCEGTCAYVDGDANCVCP